MVRKAWDERSFGSLSALAAILWRTVGFASAAGRLTVYGTQDPVPQGVGVSIAPSRTVKELPRFETQRFEVNKTLG